MYSLQYRATQTAVQSNTELQLRSKTELQLRSSTEQYLPCRLAASTHLLPPPLQACSILYKTKLPMLLAFNKCDVVKHDFALEWMADFETDHAALERDASYAATLSRCAYVCGGGGRVRAGCQVSSYYPSTEPPTHWASVTSTFNYFAGPVPPTYHSCRHICRYHPLITHAARYAGTTHSSLITLLPCVLALRCT